MVSQASVMYDILLKGESFVWVFHYSYFLHYYEVILQAGQAKVEVFENDTFVQEAVLSYSHDDNKTNKSFAFEGNESRRGKYISIRVTAIEHTDYSLAIR